MGMNPDLELEHFTEHLTPVEKTGKKHEIEGKVLEVDRVDIESRLRKIGAQFIEPQQLHALFLDTAPGGKGFIQSNRMTLRLRQESHQDGTVDSILTIKRRTAELDKSSLKAREELNFLLPDFDEAREGLEEVGFNTVTLDEQKNRRIWEYKGCQIIFDKHTNHPLTRIPEHMEIEGDTEEEVYEVARLLGIREEDVKDWGLRKLCIHYGIED